MTVGVPYTPTPLQTSVVSPSAGGAGVATTIPFISPSEYNNYPTAMATSDLVPDGDANQQADAFFSLLTRASNWVDRITMGMALATRGASLRATLNVESAMVPLVRGELKLICDYRPVLEVRGVDVGANLTSLATVGPSIAAGIRLGRRTIYVPLAAPSLPAASRSLVSLVPPNPLFCVWSYISGYPHTKLLDSVDKGLDTFSVQPTDGGGGLLGVYPGSQLDLVDGQSSESVVVKSVAGNVITTQAALAFDHVLPDGPDFIPVTGVPADVRLANIYLATGLLKTRGDEAVLLSEVTEPHRRQMMMGDLPKDFLIAMKLLQSFKVRLKAPR